jgi:hypothetical protein
MKRRQRQEKEKRKRGSNLNVPKIALFKHTLEKKSTHSLFDAHLFPLVHIRSTPSEEPKHFVD